MMQDDMPRDETGSGSKKSSSGAALGGGFVLLLVLAFGLKAFTAYQRHAKNNPPPASTYQPPVMMKPPARPVVVATVLPVPADTVPVVEESAFDVSTWSLITYDGGGFRLFAPPDPTITPVGNAKDKKQQPGETMTWRLKDHNVTLLAQYMGDVDSPLVTLFENYEQATLDASMQAIGTRGKNLKFTHITLRNKPGRDARWNDATEKEHIHGRFFMRGGRQYMLLAIADESNKDDPALAAFLDSFDFAVK